MTRSHPTVRLALAALCLTVLARELSPESVTLSTYYPAPSGVYARMITTNATFLARDAGQVGIGTTTPGAKLDVVGTVRAGGAGSGNVTLGRDPNAYIELRQSGGAGVTPYIDFSNDAASDYDARLILSGSALEHRGQGWATFRAANSGFLVDNVGGGRGHFTNNLVVGASPPVPGTNGFAVQGNARINGTLTKGAGSFMIDHPLDPEGKVLRHSFVESPDMKNVYDGLAVLGPSGEASIELPRYFESLNRDFRYQLVSIGRWAPLFVKAEVRGGRFVAASARGAQDAGLRLSWQVTGSRQDAYAAGHPIVVEEEKGAAVGVLKGSYLHPDAFPSKAPGPAAPFSRLPRR